MSAGTTGHLTPLKHRPETKTMVSNSIWYQCGHAQDLPSKINTHTAKEMNHLLLKAFLHLNDWIWVTFLFFKVGILSYFGRKSFTFKHRTVLSWFVFFFFFTNVFTRTHKHAHTHTARILQHLQFNMFLVYLPFMEKISRHVLYNGWGH